MDTPLISVIVPVYKVEQYLDRCVESIVDQTYRNLEIILVDDGSPDNCGAMCDAWAQRDNRIKVIHKENGGLSDARNAGMDLATGVWFLFIDSDDVVSTHLVHTLVFSTTTSTSLCAAGYLRFTSTPPEDVLPSLSKSTSVKELISLRSGFYCWGILYHRDIIRRNNMRFCTALRNLEDVVWNSMYLLFTDSVHFVPTPLYYYRHNSSSITSRCSDHLWQAHSWRDAEDSLFQWVHTKTLDRTQRKQLFQFFRLCQNNLFAECFVGNLSFSECRQLIIRNGVTPYFLEQSFMYRFPYIYYSVYIALMKLRNTIIAWRSRLG